MNRKSFGLKSCLAAAFALMTLVFVPAATHAEGPVGVYSGSLAELAGNWNLDILSSGNSNMWSRGELALAADGTFTGSGSNMSGDSFSVTAGSLTAAEGGGYTLSGTGGSSGFCQVDAGGSLIVCTQTDQDNSSAMIVLSKIGDSYAQADLTGAWLFDRLSAGSNNQWTISTIKVKSDGTFKGNQVSSDGSKKTRTGEFSITSDGEIVATNDNLADLNRQIRLDAGKTVVVATGTKSDGVTAQMEIVLKRAAAYTTADLAGVWQFSSMASGDAAPYWERGTVTVKSGGGFTISTTKNDGTTMNHTGTLAISSAGVITSAAFGKEAFHMVMDSGKTVIAFTQTKDSTSYVMGVLTKNPLTISGLITATDGTAIPGVTVTMTLGSTAWTTTTDSQGAYSFSGLTNNGTYKVKPSVTGYKFSPKSQQVKLKGQSATANFTGTPH